MTDLRAEHEEGLAEGRELGLSEGREKGREEARKEMASQMLRDGVDPAFVEKYFGSRTKQP